MKKNLRAIISVILSVIIVFSCVSLAAAKEETVPVIVVSGMNCFPLTDAEGNNIFPPSGDKITKLVTENIRPLVKFLTNGNWQELADEIIGDVYNDLFKEIACDEKGNSVYEIKTALFPESVDNYPDAFENAEQTEDEIGIIKGLIEDIGGENVYYFNYDWRLSPLSHADDLNAYIENVKKEKSCDKVKLIPCSMGGTVVNSYLYKYGHGDIDTIVYAMTAIQGLDTVGEVFIRGIDVETYWLMEYLFSMQHGDLMMQILIAAIATFTEVTPLLTKAVDKFIATSLDELNDRVYDELMAISFGTLPGFWALVPCSYYDEAKEVFFSGAMNESLEKLTDEYNYNVQAKAYDLMKKAADEGVKVYVLASYGYSAGPYTNSVVNQSDCLIETANQSGWANITPYGMIFTEDSVCKGTMCNDKSHNHFSTDRVIDASTCFFPENTWFIKYNKHVGLPINTDCQRLLNYLITSEEYVTVHSDESFPQFVSLDFKTGRFKSLTGPEYVYNIADSRISFVFRVIEIMRTLVAEIRFRLGDM